MCFSIINLSLSFYFPWHHFIFFLQIVLQWSQSKCVMNYRRGENILLSLPLLYLRSTSSMAYEASYWPFILIIQDLSLLWFLLLNAETRSERVHLISPPKKWDKILYKNVSVSHSVMSNSLRPHGLVSPPGFFVNKPWINVRV